jgi:small subunit ribosomal protein S17
MSETTVNSPTQPAAPSAPGAEKRANRKERTGEVISNTMAKTIIVRVERRYPHPKFKKVVTGYKKFYAHDEKSEAKVGDRVRIEETRPLSKTKRWRLVEVVERGAEITPVAA